MAELKTKAIDIDVDAFIEAIGHPVRRADAATLRAMLERVTGEPATMWGPTIIGFGRYAYRYDSGHRGETCRVGFSPRTANLVLYLGSLEGYDDMLARLGKHKRAKACIYVNKLADIDLAVLEEIARRSFEATTGHRVACAN